MNNKKVIAAGAALGLAATLFVTAPPANAEPVANGPVVVGSDTLQDVVNALANGTTISGGNVRSAGGTLFAASFDAVGSVAIQTKSGGNRFGRPNGSSDGVKALSRSIDGAPYTSATVGSPTNVTITNQVDVARSSSGATVVANGPLLYIPFGRDALSYAHSGGANAAFDNIDQATLKGLFECTITQVGGVTVVPVIPQAGSGTRKDFISKIGATEASVLEVSEGGCVVVGQEHDTNSPCQRRSVSGERGDPDVCRPVGRAEHGCWCRPSRRGRQDRLADRRNVRLSRARAPRWFRTPRSTPTARGVGTPISSSRTLASPSAMRSTTPTSPTS